MDLVPTDILEWRPPQEPGMQPRVGPPSERRGLNGMIGKKKGSCIGSFLSGDLTSYLAAIIALV